MIECIYYGENGERCIVHYNDPDRYKQKLPLGAKWDFPDEVIISDRWFRSIFKREKKLAEFTKEDFRRYGHGFRYAAKDIPLSRAMPKESN